MIILYTVAFYSVMSLFHSFFNKHKFVQIFGDSTVDLRIGSEPTGIKDMLTCINIESEELTNETGVPADEIDTVEPNTFTDVSCKDVATDKSIRNRDRCAETLSGDSNNMFVAIDKNEIKHDQCEAKSSGDSDAILSINKLKRKAYNASYYKRKKLKTEWSTLHADDEEDRLEQMIKKYDVIIYLLTQILGELRKGSDKGGTFGNSL